MVPIKLQIRNFLSYGEPPQEINLEMVPLVALVGQNGAGKSSLLDAITWALFGEARSRHNEQLIRKGATEMSVLLEFEVEGQRFRVQRRFIRKTKTHIATLEQFTGEKWRPIVIEGGVTAVNREIKRLLRMDYDTFVNTVFMPQGQSGEFMNLDPSERRDLLAKALGLETYEKLAEKAREKAKILVAQINEGERRIREIESELKSRPQVQREFERKEQEKEHTEAIIKQLEDEIALFQQKREKLLAEKVKLAHLLREKQTVQQNITENLKKITEFRSQLENWQKVIEQEQQIKEAWLKFMQVQKFEELLSEKASKLRKLENLKHQLEQSILRAKADLENELQVKEVSKKEIEKRVKEIEALLNKRQGIEQRLIELQKARSELKEWDERQKRWQELQTKKAQIEQAFTAERAKIEQRLNELKRLLGQLESRIAVKPKLEEQLKWLEETKLKLIEIQQKCENARKKKESIATQMAMLKAREEQLQRAIEETREKLHLLETHSGEPACPLCETPLTSQKVASLKRKLAKEKERLESELKEVTQQKANFEQIHNQLNKFIAQAEEELKKLHELEWQLGKVREQFTQLEEVERELKQLSEEIEITLKQKEEIEKFWITQLRELEKQELSIGYEPLTHQQIRQKAETLARFEVEMEHIRESEKELETRTEQLKRLDEEIESLMRKLATEDFAHEERTELRQVSEAIKNLGYDEKQHQQIRAWLQKNQRILQVWQQLQTAKEQVPQIRQWIDNAEKRIAEGEERLKEIEKAIDELNAQVSQLSQIEEYLHEIQRRKNARQNELNRLREEIGALRQKLEELNRLEQEKLQLGQRLQQMIEEKQDYELLAEAFGRNGIPKRIIANAVQWLEWEANQLLSRLTQGRMHLRFALETPTQKGSQKETLTIIVADELGDRPYELYSGGEKFRIDIALRVALARLLAYRSGAPLRTLIIDEGFGSQDKEGLEAIAETIKSIAKEFSRVIVVTHLDEFRDHFPAFIEVTKDSTGSRCKLVLNEA